MICFFFGGGEGAAQGPPDPRPLRLTVLRHWGHNMLQQHITLCGPISFPPSWYATVLKLKLRRLPRPFRKIAWERALDPPPIDYVACTLKTMTRLARHVTVETGAVLREGQAAKVTSPPPVRRLPPLAPIRFLVSVNRLMWWKFSEYLC